MAAEEDFLQIDIWSNSDAWDIVETLRKDLKRIFSYPVKTHDTACLADPTSYGIANGTVVVVITPDTVRMLGTTPSLNFSELPTAKPHRYYVDNEDLMSDHNTRVQLLGGDVQWTRANLECEDTKSLQSTYRQIVHSTVRGADASTTNNNSIGGKRKPKHAFKKGAFTVIPNEFQIGMIKKEKGGNRSADGTLIIETANVPWDFKGDPLTGYLVLQGEKDPPQLPIDVTKLAAKVYSFRLPDNLEASIYMMHLRDGDLATDHELGNRRITVYSSVSYISENLFSPEHLAALCDVPNFCTKQNCAQADVQLCVYFERSQLPLVLPRQLAKTFPTLLHLACYYGMEKLFTKIIDSFCSLSTLNIANVNLKKPGDLASEQGHHLLADYLSNQLMIQDMYVGQYSQYVSHDPADSSYYGDFYDTYCTISMNSGSDNGYVTGAKTVHENEDDGDYIYTVATSAPISRSASVAMRSNSLDRITPIQPQSKTLPRALYHTESLFQRDIPSGAIVSDDIDANFPREVKEISHLVANGEINYNLAEKHIRDWTRRMHSLKRQDQLDKRLEDQQALKNDMAEKYVLERKHPPSRETIILPHEITEQAPPIVPRKPSNTTAPRPAKPVKKLPAVPPSALVNKSTTSPPLPAGRQNGPVVPPRTLPLDSQSQRSPVAEEEYMSPNVEKPLPRNPRR